MPKGKLRQREKEKGMDKEKEKGMEKDKDKAKGSTTKKPKQGKKTNTKKTHVPIRRTVAAVPATKATQVAIPTARRASGSESEWDGGWGPLRVWEWVHLLS